MQDLPPDSWSLQSVPLSALERHSVGHAALHAHMLRPSPQALYLWRGGSAKMSNMFSCNCPLPCPGEGNRGVHASFGPKQVSRKFAPSHPWQSGTCFPQGSFLWCAAGRGQAPRLKCLHVMPAPLLSLSGQYSLPGAERAMEGLVKSRGVAAGACPAFM